MAEDQLQRLVDIEAIRALKVRYARYADAGYDADGLASLFTEDGVWDSGALFGRCVGRDAKYPAIVSKTSVEVDRDIAAQAAAILGTTTLRETIHASLVEVVNAQRRFELLAILGEESRFDFSAAEPAWGGDE